MLGGMTRNRIRRAVEYAKADPEAMLCVVTGYSPDFPEMRKPMSLLMKKEIHSLGHDSLLFGPEREFNTRGELRMFMSSVPKDAKKAVVSARWHLPRIRLLIRREWGNAVAKSITYIASDDPLTLRLAILELLKWVYIFIPEELRGRVLAVFKKLFGRASW